jgi:hypothetical protein
MELATPEVVTPARAVLRGHVAITLPMLLAGAMIFFGGKRLGLDPRIALLLAGAVGWAYWALMMRWWRRWVAATGADPAAVQRLATLTLLAWPGKAFELD